MLLALGLSILSHPPDTDIVTHWSAPDACPPRARVEQRLRLEREGRPAVALAVAATIRREAGGYRLRGEVTLDGRAQPIHLTHRASCQALIDKLLLYLAPLLPDIPAPPPSPTPSPPLPRGYLRGAVEGDVGTLQVCRAGECADLLPTFGGVLAGGWIRPSWRLELAVPLHTSASDAAATGGFGALAMRWFRTGLQLRVCGALERASVELLVCGEAGLQLLLGSPRAAGLGFDPARPVLPWAAVRLALAAVWWMHPRLGLRLDLAPGLNLRPRQYRAFDTIEGDAQRRRPLVEVGGPHAVLALGFDVRLGAGDRRQRRIRRGTLDPREVR